jgi:VWFA-related protein
MIGPRRGVIVGLLAGSLSTAIAQEPVFRSGVDLVTVDVAVVGGDGIPLAMLGPEDFRLRIDGQPRRIVSAQFVSLDALPATAVLHSAAHFTTNQQDEGRLVVVAADEAHIRRLEGRVALAAAADFVDRLDPRDRVGVAGLQRDDVVTFSRDRAAIRRRLLSLAGEGDPFAHVFNIGATEAIEIADGSRARLADVVLRECGRALTTYLNPARAGDDLSGERDACPEQVEQEARAAAQFARTQARMSLSALEALVASLARLEGPKTLLLLSEGLVAEPRYVDFGELAATAQAARVSIYVLHLEAPVFEAAQTRLSPTWLQDLQVRGDGLARLAGSSRGAVFRLVGGDPRPFDRIRRELSGHYLLAFEPSDADRDGRLHRIAVSLARGRGQVRARQAYRVPAAAASVRSQEDELSDLLRGSRLARDLPIRAATYTYGEPGTTNVRVVVSAEAEMAAGTGDALIGYVLVDQRGVIAASGAHRTTTGRYAFSTVVRPGEYTLRMAAIDPMARKGSVARPFAAELRAGTGLAVSDLIVARAPATPEAPLEPVVDRLGDREAVVYLEIYPAADGTLEGVSVRMEIAGSDEPVPLLSRDAPVAHRDRFATARVVFPLDTLRPTVYLARAIVTPPDGSPVTRVERPFVLATR